MDSNPKPDPLDALLATWKVDKTSQFENKVWQRIASIESTQVNGWKSFWDLLDSWLPRPAVAVSLCALFIATGVSIGHIKAQARNQQTNEALEKGYWRSVDPFQKVLMFQ